MQIGGQPGLPSTKVTTPVYNPQGTFGELLMSELNPVYYSLLKNNRVYALTALGINPAAFVGAAASTPIFGMYNPANSGVDLVLLDARLAFRNLGTAAANASAAFFGSSQGGVAVTGTQTQPTNMYSQAKTGSASYCMVNVANTGALASTLIAPSASVQTTATAAALIAQLRDEIKGSIIVSPGSYVAYGLTAALTGGVADAGLIWAEIPA